MSTSLAIRDAGMRAPAAQIGNLRYLTVVTLALLLTFFASVGTLAAADSSSSKTAFIGVELRPLVEADWLQRDGGCSLAQTREVIRRGQRLAERLQSRLEIKRLQPLTTQLNELEGASPYFGPSGRHTLVKRIYLFMRFAPPEFDDRSALRRPQPE